MTRATDAYARLAAAIESRTPECTRDRRFIDDDTDPATLAPLCAACPVFDECRAYALIQRPAGGVWAGERWTVKRRPGRPRKETP